VSILFGRTLNPINRQLTAGGSSGGEAVKIAMRGCMIGFGSDVAGSIRIPAMCNGIYGVNTSLGRMPYGGQQDGQLPGKGRASIQLLSSPLARSVADLDPVMQEIVPRSHFLDEDYIPSIWSSRYSDQTHGLKNTDERKLRVG
jgi:Asp-tRNA(Asn)/Glu-tRNA(Gln) amidotransferase A subunit family amidase